MKTLLIALAFLASASAARAAEISGPYRVVDGDTIEVGSTVVRLKGIDAAERNTELGDKATAGLKAMIEGSTITCELTGEKTYHREVGYCRDETGADLNAAMVASSLALSCPHYSTRYMDVEDSDLLYRQGRARYCN